MQSLNFDDGLKSFAINGDESRVIRFNPADPGLIERYHEALQLIEAAQNDLTKDLPLDQDGAPAGEAEENVRVVKEVGETIREALKLMFNSDVYDTVFAGQSPLAMTRGGKYLFEAFMESVIPVFEKEIMEYQKISQKRMGKYLNGYVK